MCTKRERCFLEEGNGRDPENVDGERRTLGWIIFNQPEKRNAVSQEMWQVIADMVKDLEEDGDIRVIIC
jgi:enoyl-CoA hydratase/carnithine racemase